MAKQSPVASDGKKGLFVGKWTSSEFGVEPHVLLSIGQARNVDATFRLTPQDARRSAIALIEAAAEVDTRSDKKKRGATE